MGNAVGVNFCDCPECQMGMGMDMMYNPYAGRAEKSQASLSRERFAIEQFENVRCRVEHTKITNTEMVVRNGLFRNTDDDGNKLPQLPEIILIHIFQYARPPNFQMEQLRIIRDHTLSSSDSVLKPKKYHRLNNYYESQTKGEVKATAAEADGKEMAEAAAGNSQVVASSSAQYELAMGKTDSTWKNGTAFTDLLNGQLDEKTKEKKAIDPEIICANNDEAVVETRTVNIDSDNNESGTINANKKLRSVQDIINHLHVPGKKLDIVLLNPDTHITAACWRDLNRHVKSHPGWTARRIAATKDEEKKFKFTRKGKGYFIRIVYIIPDPAVEEKKNKRKAAVAERKKKKEAGAATAASLARTSAIAIAAAIGEDAKVLLPAAIPDKTGKHPEPAVDDDEKESIGPKKKKAKIV